MYAWLWRLLPGPLPVRLLLALLCLAAVLLLLFVEVFPRVEALLPFSGVTVDGGG